jgi:hypothetical protein
MLNKLWSGGLGMSRSHLKDTDRCKASRSCGQHPTNLPTKDLTPFDSKVPRCASLKRFELSEAVERLERLERASIRIRLR